MMNEGVKANNRLGGGLRFNEGKPDYSQIPLHLMEETAKVFEYGANKYEKWNWLLGMKWSIVFACTCRHLFAWFRGERNDPESGLSHIAHAMCNLLMLTHYEKAYKEGDDRPKEYFDDKKDPESPKQQNFFGW